VKIKNFLGRRVFQLALAVTMATALVFLTNLVTPADAAKPPVVDPAVQAGLAKPNGQVPVIVRLQLPFDRYYESGPASAQASLKRQQFAQARGELQAVLEHNGTITADLPIINGFAATINSAALTALEHSPSVLQVELDQEVHPSLDTSVTDIHAPEVWTLQDSNSNTVTGVGITVAVIDTGIDYTHSDLGGCLGSTCKVLGGHDFVNNDSDPKDDNGHGTHVAGIVAGNGVLDGVAPDAKLLAYKVCTAQAICNASKVVAALDYTIDPNRDGNTSDHADVAQMSLEGTGNPDDAMSTAVDNATAVGVVAVVAAGNFGPTAGSIQSPGTARTAITVGAYCETEFIGVDNYCNTVLASFSSRGPVVWNGEDLHKPDVVAPGVQICSAKSTPYFYTQDPTCVDSQHVLVPGTSVATPHVSGAAALIKQVHPDFTPSQVKELLKATADSLGLSYDQQGAGKINIHKALPLDSGIAATPESFEAVSDPAQATVTRNQTFTITPAGSATSATLTSAATLSGVTLSVDKNNLDFSGGSDSFTATVVIDNAAAKNGGYGGSITVTDSLDSVRVIPIFITVGGTVTASPTTTLDYGIDLPSLSSWTSALQTITLTNQRQDIAQTVDITLGGLPSGVTLDAAASVNIPAGGSVELDTSLVISNNNLVGNGVYTGFIRISNATTEIKLNIKFTKYYVVNISDTNAADLMGATVWVHDHGSYTQTTTVDAVPQAIYLDFAGTYDAVVMYSPLTDTSGEHRYTVVKEGIDVSSATTNVSVSRSEASHKIELVATDELGSNISSLHGFDSALIYVPNVDRTYISKITSASDVSQNYISDLSTDYTYQTFYNVPENQPASFVYFFYGSVTGLSADQTITNTAQDLHSVQLQLDTNRTTGAAEPVVVRCWAPPLAGNCGFTDNPATTLTIPITQTVYSNAPAGTYIKQFADKARTGCGAGVCNFIFASPVIDLNTSARYTAIGGGALPAMSGGKQYTGLGPSVWNVKFNNLPTKVQLSPYISGVNAAFIRQDYAYQEYASLPYQLFRNGLQIGSGNITSFSLPLSNPFNTGNNLPAPNLSSSGATELRTSLNYQNQGLALTASVSASFDTSLTDPNPPAFKRLNYFTGSVRSDVHDSAASNHLEFELDPVGGTLGIIQAQVSIDGTNFSALTVTESSGNYSADVPAQSGSKVWLKITAPDNSNNQLVYTFQLPNANPLADTTSPTTTITAPADSAAVKGTITVSATASDNIGVTQVELYRDGTLVDTDTAAPYSFSWSTTEVGDGNHTLQTKAYDAANNFGTSSTITVTVDNTAPAVAVTAPADNATVNGTVAVTANASDTIGVVGVQFKLDGNNLGSEDTTSPYSLDWDTLTASNGNHTLTAVARDAAGNTTTAFTITVTVSNDTTAPTTAITAPSNNASIKGTVTVSANATDNIGVVGVQFKLDGSNLSSEDTSSPYSISWDTTTASNGSHTLTAVARDAAGNTTTSGSITVNVDNTVPTTSVTAPVNNATVTATITVSATASDNVAVTKVELYRDGALIDTKTVSPYDFSWNTTTVGEGAHTLQTKAYDAADNIGSSSVVNITVDNNSPTVSMTAPSNGASVSGASVTVSANASDTVAIQKVEFYRDSSVLINTDTTSPYSISWNSTAVTPGSHTLFAKAYDNAGHVTTSSSISVTVLDVTAPTTSITSPANGGTVTKKTTVTIAATSSDNVAVTRTEFYVNNVLKCTDTSSPYTCAWSVPNGGGIQYQLQTKAFDAANNMGTSAIVTVTSQ
jgi:subtilisin family serine protease